MSSSIFEGTRSGTIHIYEIGQTSLNYSAGSATQVKIEWTALKTIKTGRGAPMFLVAQGHQPLAVWIDPKQMPAFLDTFFKQWAKKNAEAARKAAFDYSEDHKTIGWVWLVLSLMFPAMLALGLLIDGYQTLSCNRLLQNGQVTSAKVLKVKKNRRGNFTWNLEFKTSQGETISGKRVAYFYDAKGNPEGGVSVVYSPTSKSCWDISLKSGQNALNQNQRDFSMFMTLTFGWIFAVIAAFSIWISVTRLRRKPAFREQVLAASRGL